MAIHDRAQCDSLLENHPHLLLDMGAVRQRRSQRETFRAPFASMEDINTDRGAAAFLVSLSRILQLFSKQWRGKLSSLAS